MKGFSAVADSYVENRSGDRGVHDDTPGSDTTPGKDISPEQRITCGHVITRADIPLHGPETGVVDLRVGVDADADRLLIELGKADSEPVRQVQLWWFRWLGCWSSTTG